MSNIVSNNPKATVAALATGLEGLAALINDKTLQKVCIIIAPAIALVLTFFYNVIIRSIESKRGLKAYSIMITDYENELNKPNITPEKKEFLEKEIEKCKININKIRTDNIKISTNN